MGKHSRKFELSKRDFEYSHENGGFKYKYLPQWLRFKSENFKNDVDNKSRKKYFHLKRGTLVYARLGVNLGTEFSGNHFCIVLDKKDNQYKETVTVIPLSSKDKKQYLKLKDNVVEHAKESIKQDLERFSKEIKENTEKVRKGSAQLKKYREILERISSSQKINDTDIEELTSIDTDLRKEHEESKEKMEILRRKHEQLGKLIDRYAKLNGKTTYAHINSITTVSKRRLLRINELDPTGRVRFSDDSMRDIDKEISRRFLDI